MTAWTCLRNCMQAVAEVGGVAGRCFAHGWCMCMCMDTCMCVSVCTHDNMIRVRMCMCDKIVCGCSRCSDMCGCMHACMAFKLAGCMSHHPALGHILSDME